MLTLKNIHNISKLRFLVEWEELILPLYYVFVLSLHVPTD